MKSTTARKFGSGGNSFTAPSAVAPTIGSALLASGTSEDADTAWSPSAACLLPDILPVAGTLLSYGGNRQLAAGGTISHSGSLYLGGDACVLNTSKIGWQANSVTPTDAYLVRNTVSSVGVKGLAGIDGTLTCGDLTASDVVSCPRINGIGTGYSVGVFGASADISSAYRNIDINAPSGLPVLQFKTNGTLRAQHYWESNVFNIYSAGNHALTSSSATQMLGFGGLMVGTPALKRVLNTLQVRLGDDSSYADLATGALTASGAITSTYDAGGFNAAQFRGPNSTTLYMDQFGQLAYSDATKSRFGVSLTSFHLPSDGEFGISSGNVFGTITNKLSRGATGPTWDLRAAGGIRSRTLDNSADAPITGSTFTASDQIIGTLFKAASQSLPYTSVDHYAGLYVDKVVSGVGLVREADMHMIRGISGASTAAVTISGTLNVSGTGGTITASGSVAAGGPSINSNYALTVNGYTMIRDTSATSPVGYHGKSGFWMGNADDNYAFASYKPSLYFFTNNEYASTASAALALNPSSVVITKPLTCTTITASGTVTLADGSNAAPSLVWSSGYGLYKGSVGTSFKGGFELYHSGARAGYWQWDGISVRSDAAIGFSPTTSVLQGGGGDAYFVRNSASSIGVKGASGIDGAITCGALTATGAGAVVYINRSGMSSFSLGDANGDTLRIQNAGDLSDMLRIHGTTKAATFYGGITTSGNIVFGSSALLKISSGRLVVRSAADTGYYGFMAQEFLVPAAGTFQFSGNAYMESAADTIVMKNWAGSAGAALTCGAINSSLGYGITSAAGMAQINNGAGTVYAYLGNASSQLNGQTLFIDTTSGAHTWTSNGTRDMVFVPSSGRLKVTGSIQDTPAQSALDPTTTNIPSGKRQGWYNSTITEFRDWVNIGGTLLKSAAYT